MSRALAAALLLAAGTPRAGEPLPEPERGNPVPEISSLSPERAAAGGPGFTLGVSGGGFLPMSVVRWNGADRRTVFVSAESLTAELPASDLAAAGEARVSVHNPPPGGGESTAASFIVSEPAGGPAPNAPSISSLLPAAALAGGPGFTLVIDGARFGPGSVARWNGLPRATTHIDSSRLEALIPASDVAAPGTATVTVTDSVSGAVSNPAAFTVLPAPGAPAPGPSKA